MKKLFVKPINAPKLIGLLVLWAFLLGILLFIGINLFMVGYSSARIHSVQDTQPAQCAIVLGARVRGDRPMPMLQERLDTALELYEAGKVDKILCSGDHGQIEYDEVNIMRQYLQDHGVPREDIFMDHAGFDTYSTMYRAQAVFQVESAVVVTQRYHLYRGVYCAGRRGIMTQGVICDRRIPARIVYYTLREWLARVKDFFYVEVIHPLPKYLGEALPITGDGIITEG